MTWIRKNKSHWLATVWYDSYLPATEASKRGRIERSKSSIVHAKFLVVKDSWKQIVYKKKVLVFDITKDITSQEHCTSFILLVKIVQQWTQHSEQLERKMASMKVLVFILGVLLIFVEFHKSSAASLLEDLDGRLDWNSNRFFFFCQNISPDWLPDLFILITFSFIHLRQSFYVLLRLTFGFKISKNRSLTT